MFVHLLLLALAVPVGVVAWTFTEYAAHRFTMHNVGGRGPAAKEHLMHHAQPERCRAFIRTLGHIGMYTTAVAIGFVLWLVLPWSPAIGLAVGWAIGYTIYEACHWLAHHREPRGIYDLQLRRRHFHHHFVAPRTNLGVTTDAWDRLFGTEAELSTIKVPRRLAMPWLTDAYGAVRPEFADDYEIVGRLERTAQQDAADITDAFADRPVSLH